MTASRSTSVSPILFLNKSTGTDGEQRYSTLRNRANASPTPRLDVPHAQSGSTFRELPPSPYSLHDVSPEPSDPVRSASAADSQRWHGTPLQASTRPSELPQQASIVYAPHRQQVPEYV